MPDIFAQQNLRFSFHDSFVLTIVDRLTHLHGVCCSLCNSISIRHFLDRIDRFALWPTKYLASPLQPLLLNSLTLDHWLMHFIAFAGEQVSMGLRHKCTQGLRQWEELLKLDLPLLTDDRFPYFTNSSSVRDLWVGLILDSSLTFSDHFSTLTCSCYFHLKRLRRRSITLICYCIDYCNSLLIGLSNVSRLSIQSV